MTKRKFDKEVTKALAKKEGVSERHFRRWLDPANKSIKADEIREEYQRAVKVKQIALEVYLKNNKEEE